MVVIAGLGTFGSTGERLVAGFRPRPAARGFTTLELLVSMAIISLLLALTLPAIGSAREAARRTVCKNNLHQLGTAMHAFEAAQGRFPASGFRTVEVTGGPYTVKNISPHVELLPFLDQAELFRKFNTDEMGWQSDLEPPASQFNAELLQHRLALFECPSDVLSAPRNNYLICAGTSPHTTEYRRSPGAPALQGFLRMRGRKDRELRDGKSNTVAFSERVGGDRNTALYSSWQDVLLPPAPRGTWLLPDTTLQSCRHPAPANPRHYSYAGYTWALSNHALTWYNHVGPPNSSVPDCASGPALPGMYSARSMHPGGVHVLLCDGGSRFVSESIDLAVWRGLGTIAGNEVIPEF